MKNNVASVDFTYVSLILQPQNRLDFVRFLYMLQFQKAACIE